MQLFIVGVRQKKTDLFLYVICTGAEDTNIGLLSCTFSASALDNGKVGIGNWRPF